MEDNSRPMTDEAKDKLPELSEVLSILKAVQGKQNKDALDREQIVKLTEKFTEIAGEMSKASKGRRSEYSEDDVEDGLRSGRVAHHKALDAILNDRSGNPDIEKAQEILDRSYILSEITKKPVHELKYFRRGIKDSAILSKWVDLTGVGGGSTADGSKWQPVTFSQRMIEKVRLNLTVAALHPRINMPADPYKFPVEGNDANAYLVSEQGEVDADLTANKRVSAGLTDLGSGNISLSSKKIGARIVLSNEVDEDSFVPIMDYVEGKLALAMAEAQDNIMINGALTGSIDPGALYGTGDQRGAWNGYRQFLQTVTTARVAAATSTPTIQMFRAVRQAMGKYAINPRDFVWVCGPIGYIKLLGLGDAQGTSSPVLTVDKYGPNATILTGEMGKLDGSPIVITEFIGVAAGRETLNATGVFQALTDTATAIYAVRPSAYLFGDRRAPSLKSREIIETDQQVLVVLQRLTCALLYPSVPVVGGLVNIIK